MFKSKASGIRFPGFEPWLEVNQLCDLCWAIQPLCASVSLTWKAVCLEDWKELLDLQGAARGSLCGGGSGMT